MRVPIRIEGRSNLPKLREADIQKLITDWLSANGIWWFRTNSGGTVRTYKGKSRYIRFGKRGMADLMAVRKLYREGTTVICSLLVYWIECKAPKGIVSDDQRAFKIEVESQGMKYILARSLEDVEKGFL